MISIIIPVYNSEKTIGCVVEKTISAIENYYKYEIILINDGSIDNSSQVCKNIVDKNSSIRLINLSKNFEISLKSNWPSESNRTIHWCSEA